ncbi:LysR family transcriptional regulator [Rhodoferax saidenbachensis]|uniref:LysR family transcriptional regulator n=1 Tax=Rhodoferax saidenbachensis TaxID=1484693 RepID=A0A1P8KES8_9BURK|nr:LysR family transcriptional regulator [Rhodoferax saidenbachensis]APW44540.1 LysR family transcriptional regulator [Rhodoferax saidenbachensis]
MLDLNQMALFVQVVQAGSFAEASRRLGMPPTTLSRQVAQLEDSLQARLLQRTTRKLTLTDAGRTLFDQSAAQIATLQDAASALAGKDQTPKGHVRVAAPSGFFDYFLMDWVAEFLAAHPAVQLEFVLSDGMADVIGEGIDVAFRGSGELPDSSLVARKVTSSYLALAASPAYLAARGTPQTIADLTTHDCICPAHTGGHGTWNLNSPDGPVQVPVKGRLGASTGQAQRQAAESGLGICLLPINALRDSLRDGTLVEVLPGVASAPAGLFVVYPSRRHVPRAVTAFVEMAVQRLMAVI